VQLLPLAALSNHGAVAPGITVNWSATSGSMGFPGGTESTSGSDGLATIAATAGPLAAGAAAAGSACATIGGQPDLCASFTATGVDPSLWTVAAIEGAAQTVTSTGVLQPVVFQVTDGSGDPVVGAPVTVYQTVSGYQVCPATGRCPAAPVYATSQATAVSDGDGLVVATVQQVASSAETTTIAASTGTQGFVTVLLQKTP
jgi:hypothetical protein